MEKVSSVYLREDMTASFIRLLATDPHGRTQTINPQMTQMGTDQASSRKEGQANYQIQTPWCHIRAGECLVIL